MKSLPEAAREIVSETYGERERKKERGLHDPLKKMNTGKNDEAKRYEGFFLYLLLLLPSPLSRWREVERLTCKKEMKWHVLRRIPTLSEKRRRSEAGS